LSDNRELLQQRVTKHQQKLDQATTVVELTQARFDAASTAHDEAARDLKRKKSALKLAKARYRRLEKEAKRASELAKAVGQDRADAKNELAEHRQVQEKRQAKLAKAEAALAAEQAVQDVATTATKSAASRKRAAGATKKTATPRTRASTATKKTAAPRKRATTKKTTTKKAPTRKS
jgi:hypothetical protein